MLTGNRLKEIREAKKLTLLELSDLLQISDRTLGSYEREERKPSAELIEALLTHLQLSPEWLFTGKGKMFVETKPSVIKIPFRSEIEAAAGNGCYVYNENITEFIEVPEKIIKEINANSEQSDFILARGDSMEPTIYNKDKILIDRSKIELKDSRIYVVRLEDRILVKGAEIVLISDNKDFYSPIPVNLINDDVTICGQVLWMMRELI
jgi:phage repressor protein C with HTH and peptisase S24 domain